MYYHVIIETNEKINQHVNKEYFELDKLSIEDIEEEIIIPYLKNEEFQFDGYFLSKKDIKRIVIKETEKSSNELSSYENDHMGEGIIYYVSNNEVISYDKYSKDITKNIFITAKEKIKNFTQEEVSQSVKNVKDNKKDIFIVHGHDDLAKSEVARFIEQINFKPIILHEQASEGTTIIEKIEKYSDVGFGIVLYTACDVGAKNSDKDNLNNRARQNVVFEHGFLNGKLGRKNVCAFVKGDIETPNDISGIVYVPLDTHGAWKIALAKELRASGYDVDMNNVI